MHLSKLSLVLGFTLLSAALQAEERSYELDANYSFTGGATTGFHKSANGSVSEQSAQLRSVISIPVSDTVLGRVGLDCELNAFGIPNSAPLPNTLESTSLVLGLDVQAFESWIVRLEATPGIYSDFHDLNSGDLNIPVALGASYIAGPDLQWVLGLRFDANARYPVLPGIGVRWKFTDKWVLNAIPPTPRLEYQLNKAATLYLGADLRGSTYRVEDRFGSSHGNPQLNGAVVELDEIRTGAGATWKLRKDLTFGLEAGYLPYRKFDFYRADTSFKTRSGAPYGQFAISSRF
ncbi:MAG: DUF6268 family outer membrane beta-barrel protein [Verrucomicrobiota bacterium]